jgi:hypothetical protein
MFLFIASTLAVFVLLTLFEPDIKRHWAAVHRSENAPIVAVVTQRYQALIAHILQRIGRADEKLYELSREHVQVSEARSSVADVDRQISDLLEHVKQLEVAKTEAERLAIEHERDVQVKLRGPAARGHIMTSTSRWHATSEKMMTFPWPSAEVLGREQSLTHS